jgi:hypothetical protein
VHDAERVLVRRRERSLEEWKDPRSAQRRQRVPRAQRDVDGPAPVMPRPRSMRRAGSRRDELPPGASSLSAPTSPHRELELSASPAHAAFSVAPRASCVLRRDFARASLRIPARKVAQSRSRGPDARRLGPSSSAQGLAGPRGERAISIERRSSEGGGPQRLGRELD